MNVRFEDYPQCGLHHCADMNRVLVSADHRLSHWECIGLVMKCVSYGSFRQLLELSMPLDRFTTIENIPWCIEF